MRLSIYALEPYPEDPAQVEAQLRFARRMGAIAVAVPNPVPDRPLLERLCRELDLHLYNALPARKPTINAN